MFAKIGYQEGIDICWDITTVCNFKCPYCFNRREYSRPSIFNRRMIDAALDMISRIKHPVTVGLLGGEPTLHPLLNHIVSRLVALSNVIKIKVVSNAHKDLSYIINDPKVHLCLSYHPLGNSFYMGNLALPRVTVYILMVKSEMDRIMAFYNEARWFNVDIVPEYIVAKDDSVKVFDSAIPDPLLYTNDGAPLSFKEAHRMSFSGATCNLSHYKIRADGSVLLECTNTVIGTINDPDISEKITIQPVTCTKACCGDDFLMEMRKS